MYWATRIFYILLCYFSLGGNAWGWDNFLFAKPDNHGFSNSDTVKTHQIPSPHINRHFLPKRIDFNHIEGKGVGYNRGYTGVKTVTGPEYQKGHLLPLIELNGAIFDDGKFGANIGFIGRYLPKSYCTVFGFNFFYDFRQGKRGSYNQVGGGFELLNKRWEMHVNGYIPVGVKKHVKKCVFDDYIGPFRAVKRRYEFAAYAADASLGYYLVNGKNFQLFASGGAYYFSGKFNKHAVGGKGMLRPQFGDYFSVELSVSHDHIFETIYQVNAILSIPLYSYSSSLKNKKGPCGMSNRQIYQPINREVILLKECCWKTNF